MSYVYRCLSNGLLGCALLFAFGPSRYMEAGILDALLSIAFWLRSASLPPEAPR